jgi:subtilisin family serine protease
MKRLSFLVVSILFSFSAVLFAQEKKIVVHSQADLPRYTYEVNLLPSELLGAEAPFTMLLSKVKTDLLKLFNTYEIEDASTQKSLYAVLFNIAIFEEDYTKAESYLAIIKELEEKPSAKLMSGLLDQAIIASYQAGENSDEVFQASLSNALEDMPWEVVQDDVEAIKGSFEILSKNLLVGIYKTQFDPAVKETGQISGDLAQQIIGGRYTIDKTLPMKEFIVEVFEDYIVRHRVEKTEIWTDRDLALTEEDKLTPVVIGIWDSGTDPLVFGPTMHINMSETLNGKDTDSNGYIDDLNGIAYGIWSNGNSSDMLYPLSEEQLIRYPTMLSELKGMMDIQSNIDSDEAKELKQKLSAMQPEEVSPFLEELGLFGNYVHGTHVAGIASKGNPAARILVMRETFPHKPIPEPLMKSDAERWAKNSIDIVNYFKLQGVKVVNMSWGLDQKSIEGLLEMNGIGSNSDERAAMAKETIEILHKGFSEAIKSAPGILFIPAAGNADVDVDFVMDIPASIDLPNVLVSGAVDQAGEETGFTSFGKSVDVYASGFEVESYVPGGTVMNLSGTSMSAPAVTNLAAKLIAIDPSLTPEKVKELILKGSDRSQDGRILLLNPKKTIGFIKQ